MRDEDETGQGGWVRTAGLVWLTLVVAAYLIGMTAKPAVLLSGARLDDGLFMAAAKNLADGDWLGTYRVTTLAKGPGYPFFLALARIAGVPAKLAEALLYAGAALFFARVLSQAARRAIVLPIAGTLLLCLAPLAMAEVTARIMPDFFQAALALLFLALVLDLLVVRRVSTAVASVLAGIVLAWLIASDLGLALAMLAAALVVLILSLIVARRESAPVMIEIVLPAGAAAALAGLLVAAVMMINQLHYGVFTLVETSGSFAAAERSLASAGYANWRSRVAVTAASRQAIYGASPSFARLRQALEQAAGGRDFAPGAFRWALRDAASQAGLYSSAPVAEAFWRAVATEVDAACAAGRLQCAPRALSWLAPLTADQAGDAVLSAARVAAKAIMLPGIELADPNSSFLPGTREVALYLVGHPPIREAERHFAVEGWYHEGGARWFAPIDSPGMQVNIVRRPSPDVATAMSDREAVNQRFALDGRCTGPCVWTIADSTGQRGTVNFATQATPGSVQIGRGRFQLDDIVFDDTAEAAGPRAAWSQRWREAIVMARPLTILVGLAGLAMWVVGRVRGRNFRRSPMAIVAAGLFAALAARLVGLVLVDATAQPADGYAAAFAGIILFTGLGLAGLAEAIGWRGDWAWSRRDNGQRRSDRPSTPPPSCERAQPKLFREHRW